MISIQNFWAPIFAAAVWIGTSSAAFLNFPIRLSSVSTIHQFVTGATVPLIAIICGFLTVMPKLFRPAPRTHQLLLLAFVCFVCFLLSVTTYFYLQLQWTCQYTDSVRLVVGVIKDDSCEQVLLEIGGLTEEAFPSALLHRRFMLISSSYMSSWVFLASLLVALADAARAKRTTTRQRLADRSGTIGQE
ncbi:hypothetical protein [Massilia sp. S19_KUP03_FR1]|uniref:hypothetical protein n=1 Tax=Massilia sp. S19_KUP03_FR1 TaxID=3025503 RepID=UPI002FCD8927